MKQSLLLSILLLLLVSCDRFGKKQGAAKEEQRIVCIAKQYNEIIWALGAQQNMVGVDISSTYPTAIQQVQTVGYHRALSTEGILATRPTLLLHDNNIGPEHVVQQLEALKIPMKVFDNTGSTIDSTKMLIREIGAYFGKEKAADSICRRLDQDMELAMKTAKQYTKPVYVLVVHFGQATNAYFVMTKNSSAAKLIQWAGGELAVEGTRGMQPISAELVAASDPDVILLTDYGYDRLGNPEKIRELPGIAGTAAARRGKIYRVEEHDLVYLGPRTGEIIVQLQKLIHQDVK
ncbi:heme/hemin ABC transporter substrate-binding protein [Flavihumibacter sp. UBA7668]|uniref:heme/hemin ABC transporter substrate-binding protein n=1 Tax=Flavihumibacter sp. UBA7668 TaxID=1946542 RepID=UPI0025BF5F49|nr:ABC transporter substrate-binding protein [Flavihumibacter sp. UBA7668]